MKDALEFVFAVLLFGFFLAVLPAMVAIGSADCQMTRNARGREAQKFEVAVADHDCLRYSARSTPNDGCRCVLMSGAVAEYTREP